MKNTARLLRLSIVCLMLGIMVSPWPASADAMQDILDRQADVEQALREIINNANSNNGERSPDPALELAIGRLEAHLRSMDFRLESLPACRRAPSLPNTDDVLAALRRLNLDPREIVTRRTELKTKITRTWQRRVFLDTVQDTTKRIVIAKSAASLAGIFIAAMPGAGPGFDAAGVLDSALTHMGINPTDNYRPRTFRGAREYRQYLAENKDALTRFMQQRAEETLRKDPRYRFSEQDILLWAHDFILKKLPGDRQAAEQEIKVDREELARLDRRLQGQGSNNNYFAGLLARLENAFRDSKWIQDPKQFEKMKAELKVVVIDDSTSRPIISPNVNPQPMPGTQRTANNPFEYENVGLGAYTIKASSPGFVAETAQVEVKDCQIYPLSIRLKRKPRVTIKDIKDEDGRLIDDVKVDLVNIGSGGSVGSGTYRRLALGFIVDPGAITVSATDPASIYEAASANVTAEAGQDAELHLVMRKKSDSAFVVEVYDSLSGMKIDPPPGSNEPEILLEPLEGQIAPSPRSYGGNGELPFDSIRAGRYKYRVSFCGWESQSGEFIVSSDELRGKRIVRRVSVKPHSLDSFTGNVIETGTDDHIDGFKVTLIGLGPRQGYRYDAVEGKDPDPNSHTLWGAFIINGPIYSGRYRLIITRDCYQPLVSDTWWTFCLDRGAYTPQILRIDATPEFEQARQQARALTAQINSERQKAREAADQIQDARRKSQDLSSLAADLRRELDGLKQRYATLEQDCAKARDAVVEVQRVGNMIQGSANRITILRETAKNLAGVACELSDKAQQATDPAKAANHSHNSEQFAKQTRKTTEEARTLAEDMRSQLAALELQDFRSIEQAASGLKQAFASSSGKLQDLRGRLDAASQAVTSLAQANAALAAADRLLATIKQLMQPCAVNHPGKVIVENAQQSRNGVAAEQQRAIDENALLQSFLTNAQASATSADNLGGDIAKTISSCDGLKGIDSAMADARATVDTIEVFAEAAADSARAAEECSSRAAQLPQSTTGNGTDTPTNEIPAALGPGKGSKQAPTDEVPTALGRPTGALGAPIPIRRQPNTSNTGQQDPTDELPAALGSGKGKQTPTDELPAALGSGKSKQTPTDDLPAAIGSGKSKQTPTDDLPAVLGSGKGKQTPSDELPGVIGSSKGRSPGGGQNDNQSTGTRDQQGGNTNSDRNRGTSGQCTMEGTWSQNTPGVAATEWHITKDGKATETGGGYAKGTATLSGRTLHINWQTDNGYAGYYQWGLTTDCTSGTGNLVFSAGGKGSHDSTVRRR